MLFVSLADRRNHPNIEAMTQASDQYTAIAKALHWIIALMIIVQIPAGIWMHAMAFSDTKFLMYQMHKSFGLVVLTLSLFRLYWRLTHRPPALPSGMKGWERLGAQFSHIAFYVVIIGIPLTGWLMVSASTTGIDTKLFFVIPIPHWPVPVSEASEEFFTAAHEWIAKATIGLIFLHVGAALKHHFKDRDDVLTRMLPAHLQQKLAQGSSASAPHSENEQ